MTPKTTDRIHLNMFQTSEHRLNVLISLYRLSGLPVISSSTQSWSPCSAHLKDGTGCRSFPALAHVLLLTPTTWQAKTGAVSAFHLGSADAKARSFLDPGTCFPNPNPSVTKAKAESLSLEPTCRDQDLHAQRKADGRHGCVICSQTETIIRVPALTFQQNLQRARGQTKTDNSHSQLC